LFARILFSFLLISSASHALDLHSPAFEKLDQSAIAALLDPSETSPASTQRLQELMAHFFMAESLSAHEKIHAAKEHLETARNICEHFGDYEMFRKPEEKGRAALTCVLVRSEWVFYLHSWNRSDELRLIEKDLNVAHKSSTSLSERLYVEGRIFGLLPRGMGRNVGRSIMALESLVRLAPQYPSSYYWLLRVQEFAGNLQRSQEVYHDLKTRFPNDIRLAGYERRKAMGSLEPGFGIVPMVFYSPSQQFGGGLYLYDDRIFDTFRKGNARLYGSMRGNFGADFRLHDFSFWAGSELIWNASAAKAVEDYYGLGFSTNLADATALDVRRLSAGVLLKQYVWDSFYVAVGWQAYLFHLAKVTGPLTIALPQSSDSFYSGVVGEIGLDNLGVDPDRGVRASLRGFLPTKKYASSSSFERIEGQASSGWLLGSRYFLNIQGQGIYVKGAAPFDAYPKLAGDFEVRGIRHFRYREKSGVVFSSEVKKEFSPSIRGGVFGLAANLNDSFSKLLNGGWKPGGGAFVEFSFARLFSGGSRLEVGYFNQEWVIAAQAGTTL
jgi:hypothetical protein